ncbi:MAG: MFS transporter [Armatimonadota bacterium]|nr:MFS transporter [Armatimonadota bacterium]MDR7404779.1 MFS transporter [Armatimonadota bacterium]
MLRADMAPPSSVVMCPSAGAPVGPVLPPTLSTPRARAMLVLSWLAGFNCRAPLLAAGPLLPLVIRDLHLSATAAGALTGVPLFAMAALSVPGGLLVDRAGPWRVLMAAQLAIAVGGGLRGAAGGALTLLVPAALLGAGISLSQPALARVAQVALPGRAAVATAVYVNGLILGVLAGTTLSTTALLALVGPASWRGVCALWALPGLAAAAGWAVLRRAGSHESPSAVAARSPAGWRVPGFAPVVVAFAAQAMIFYGAITWLPEFYVTRGWSVAAAAVPVTAVAAASVAVSVLAPVLVAASGGYRTPFVIAAALAGAGQVGVALAPAAGTAWGALIGAGTTLAFALGLAAAADLVPADRVGAATGLMLTAGHGAATAAPLLLGAARDLSGGFTAGWVLMVGAAAALAAAACRVPEGRRQPGRAGDR